MPLIVERRSPPDVVQKVRDCEQSIINQLAELYNSGGRQAPEKFRLLNINRIGFDLLITVFVLIAI